MTKIAEQRSHTFGRKTFAKWGEKLFEFVFLSSEIWDFTRHLYFQNFEICRDICIFWTLRFEETFNFEMGNENSKKLSSITYFREKNFLQKLLTWEFLLGKQPSASMKLFNFVLMYPRLLDLRNSHRVTDCNNLKQGK